jgi:hypothetical protein
MNAVARSRSLIDDRYSKLAALESIGGNAGPMSRAVNGAADVETGEMVELGNVQNLSRLTRARLAAGAVALFTIREELGERASIVARRFTLFADAAFGARARRALEEVVDWMKVQERIW